MTTAFNPSVICPILIGRTAELAAFHLLIDQVKSGRGQVALLSGEAGVGKSRLVAQAKTYATAQGFLLLQGQCFPTDHSCPYAPLLDLLRSHLATSSREQVDTEMGSLASALSPLLLDLLPLPSDLPSLPPLDSEHEKRRLFAALAHLFLRQATKQPALLIVEDLHWSDETSLDFLHFLARRCPASPLLVLLTYRSDEVHPGLSHFLAQLDRERIAQEFALAPLTRGDVSAMLHAIFDLRRSVFMVPPLAQGELLDAMYALTEGNPFIIEELLKSLIEAGDIFDEQGRWERKERSSLHIPRSVQDAVELRTAHLSEGARQVLNMAAVAGRHFDFALLQELTRQDEAQLLQIIKELIAAQLVVEESAEQFAFRHALTRQAVSAQLLVRERRALHRTIAETFERLYASSVEAHLADLSFHISLAGAWEKALEYGQRAGEHAQSGDYYQRALILARTMDDPAALAHSLNRLGNWYLNVEQPQEALHCHQEALATFQALSDRRGKAATLDLLGMASFLSGDLIQGTTSCQQAIVLLRELDDRQRLISSLVTLMMCGGVYETETLVEASVGFADSLHFGEQALKIAGEIGSRSDEAHTLIQMAMYLGPHGEYAQALEVAQRGLAIAEEIEHRQWMTAGHRALGALYLDLLALSEAQQHLEQALALAQEVGSWNWIRIISGFLAPTYLLQHDEASADSLLTAALEPDAVMQTLGQRLVWAARAGLALARDDPHLALHITDQLLASAVGLSSESSIPRLAKLRGEALIKLKQAAEAETILQDARTTALKHGLRPSLARLRLTHGQRAHGLRRYEEAERRFAEALEMLEDLASSLPDQAFHQHFLQHAQALFPRTRQPSAHRLAKKTFGGLTQRERTVAALIAQGKSNREIADV